jgi:YceI-like domain
VQARTHRQHRQTCGGGDLGVIETLAVLQPHDRAIHVRQAIEGATQRVAQLARDQGHGHDGRANGHDSGEHRRDLQGHQRRGARRSEFDCRHGQGQPGDRRRQLQDRQCRTDRDVKENALEAQRFPQITFVGDSFPEVYKDGKLSAKLRLLGKLTLHGVTKDIVLPVTAHIDNQGRFIADGSYTFKFEDYGVKRPSKMMGLMTTGDKATIDFHVVADPA